MKQIVMRRKKPLQLRLMYKDSHPHKEKDGEIPRDKEEIKRDKEDKET